MNNERWKEIPGYEGYYEASTLGHIRSVRDERNTYNGKILRPRLKPNGYLQYGLTRDGKTRTFKSSRLIAKTFLPNPENKLTVNHKNGIKNDDRLENLEWATISENTQHAVDTGLLKPKMGEDVRGAKITNEQALQISHLLDKGVDYRIIAQAFGVHKMCIQDIKHGRTWTWLTKRPCTTKPRSS